MQKNNKWFEELPEDCPPISEVKAPSDFVCYRIVYNNPPKPEDYYSVKRLDPNRKVPQCQGRACSVFEDKSEALRKRKLIQNKEKRKQYLAKMKINRNDGVIKKTGRPEDTHHSWWILKEFNPKIISVEECKDE